MKSLNTVYNVYSSSQDDEDAFTSLGTGNRMATVLFYVSLFVCL